MRRQHKSLGRAKGPALGRTLEHPGPEHARCDAGPLCPGLQLGLQLHLVGAGDDQVNVRVLPGDPRKRVQEQITALFLVNAGKKKQEAAIAQRRHGREKRILLLSGVAPRRVGAVGHDHAGPLIGPETSEGQLSLQLTGKQHRRGIVEDVVLQRPVQQLFQVLERVALLEENVQSPVREDRVRNARVVRGEKSRHRGKQPNIIDDDQIKPVGVGA